MKNITRILFVPILCIFQFIFGMDASQKSITIPKPSQINIFLENQTSSPMKIEKSSSSHDANNNNDKAISPTISAMLLKYQEELLDLKKKEQEIAGSINLLEKYQRNTTIAHTVADAIPNTPRTATEQQPSSAIPVINQQSLGTERSTKRSSEEIITKQIASSTQQETKKENTEINLKKNRTVFRSLLLFISNNSKTTLFSIAGVSITGLIILLYYLNSLSTNTTNQMTIILSDLVCPDFIDNNRYCII